MFDPEVQVPKAYVRSNRFREETMQENRRFGWQEPARRKRRVLKERHDDEKVIHSKALLFKLAETPPPAAEAAPSPRDKAAAFIVPEAVLPVDDDEDDDFQVTFSFGLWCHCTDSSCGWYRISEPRTK